ncbi:hypothetical protein ACFL0D_04185 [Thermoproteota archaeon]
MKKKKRSNTTEIEEGIEVQKIDDSLISIGLIEETTPIINIRDYINVKNLDKKK